MEVSWVVILAFIPPDPPDGPRLYGPLKTETFPSGVVLLTGGTPEPKAQPETLATHGRIAQDELRGTGPWEGRRHEQGSSEGLPGGKDDG